jgi:hypothetical protein
MELLAQSLHFAYDPHVQRRYARRLRRIRLPFWTSLPRMRPLAVPAGRRARFDRLTAFGR